MKNNLNNISPIDGRYAKLTQELNRYFSESALIKYRVYIEIKYFIKLWEIGLPELKKINRKDIQKIKKNSFRNFNARYSKSKKDRIYH